MINKIVDKFGDDKWFYGTFLRWWNTVWISVFIGFLIGLSMCYPIILAKCSLPKI